MVKLFLKRVLMNLFYAFLVFYGFLSNKKNTEIKTIGVLFLPYLGMGDLIMLSPAIKEISNIFPNAKVYIVTNFPVFLEWDNIILVKPSEIKNSNLVFDLFLSPTLNLRHLPYVFKAKYWLGYFAKPICQSNFLSQKCSYDLREGHYLLRMASLLKLLNDRVGIDFEKRMNSNRVEYPNFIVKEPDLFSSTLAGKRYAVFGVLSKWPDRQWPVDNFVAVAEWMIKEKIVDSIVIIGDSSKENINLAAVYEKKLAPSQAVINLAGKTNLAETAYIIKNTELYLGLDSGPTHFAYNLAARIVAIFVTVDPKLRLPLFENLDKKVHAVYLDQPPVQPLYNGLAPVSSKLIAKYFKGISVESVKKAIKSFYI